jgi:DNA-binding response OmpR family regulator
MGQLIFVVNEDSEVCQLASQALNEADYAMRICSMADLVREIEVERPALVLVAMVLLNETGLAVSRLLFRDSVSARIPLVFLLHDAGDEDRLLAFESGADDCIVKPFSPRELVARVQAVLRRPAFSNVPAGAADLVIDNWAMKVSVRGIEIPITTLEFRLLEYLARHRGQVFTRDFLLDAVWGDMQFITPRSVDACIRRIREKIEPDRAKPALLKTIRGVGYRLDAVAWSSQSYQNCDCAACRTRTSSALPPAYHPNTRKLSVRAD